MKSYEPTDSMRRNQLSFTPGGSTIKVVYEGHEVIYTRVKYPNAYIKKILTDVQPEAIWVDDHLTHIKQNGTITKL